jgi:hypothetical protein
MPWSPTEKVQGAGATLPEASVAVQLTAVVVAVNRLPEGGVQAVVTPGQLSLADGGGKLTAWGGTPSTLMSTGQATMGG